MDNRNIYNEIKDLKIELEYDLKAIIRRKNTIKEYSNEMDKEGFNKHGVFLKGFINTNKEMIIKTESCIKINKEKIKKLTIKKGLMLKYFKNEKNNLTPKTEGMILKLLNKTYNNDFYNKGLKGYSVKLWELINFSIENNIEFYLQFKTLINNCLKVFDDDLRRWVAL